jgi:hypothetical protein
MKTCWAVERDVDLMREATLLLRKVFSILTRDLGSDFDIMPARILPLLFAVGKLIVWADLSLRRRGFSEIINTLPTGGVTRAARECDEKLERELAEASQGVGFAFNNTVDVMAESFCKSEGAD